jgi:hypothetical protein
MWAVIAAALAQLVPVLIDLWGPPSPEERAALLKACEPLPSPGPADKVLADIERDRSGAITAVIPVFPPTLDRGSKP